MASRHRSWCITWNNYDLDSINALKDLKSEYLIIGDEVGALGTPHLQAYVRLTNGVSFKAISKKLKGSHIELAMGTDIHNKDYCSKQTVLWESGTPSEQGKRTDIQRVHDLVKDGATMRDIIPSARSMQSIKVAQTNLVYFEPRRSWKPTVYWFHGHTGTGKTRMAHQLFPDAWTNMGNAKWFEGYDAHEDVIFDDFSPDQIPYKNLLRLLDRYPYRVECKGGSRQFLARNIVITSSSSPHLLFSLENQHGNELIRRIDKTLEFPCVLSQTELQIPISEA